MDENAIEEQFVLAYQDGTITGHDSPDGAIQAARNHAAQTGSAATSGILYRVPVSPRTEVTIDEFGCPQVPGTEVVRRVPLVDGAMPTFQLGATSPSAEPSTPEAPSEEPDLPAEQGTTGPEEEQRPAASPSMMGLF